MDTDAGLLALLFLAVQHQPSSLTLWATVIIFAGDQDAPLGRVWMMTEDMPRPPLPGNGDYKPRASAGAGLSLLPCGFPQFSSFCLLFSRLPPKSGFCW